MNAAINEVRSSIIPDGHVIAYKGAVDMDGDTATVDAADQVDAIVKVSMDLSVALQGTPIDLTPPFALGAQGELEASGLSNTLVVSYMDSGRVVGEAAWTVRFTGANDGDYSLEATERATVTVWLVEYEYDTTRGLYYTLGGGATDPFADDTASLLTKYESFSLGVSPVAGAPLQIERVAPQSLNTIMNLR